MCQLVKTHLAARSCPKASSLAHLDYRDGTGALEQEGAMR